MVVKEPREVLEMKKNKELIYLILAILCVWCPLFMGAWNKAKPASSTSMRSSNPEILANWDAIETAFGQDHEFSTGGTNSGKHEVLTMEEEASAGASSTDEGHLQVIDGGSQPEMAFTSEDGDELQFTKDGDLFSSDGLVVTEASTFNGSITLGDGDDLIGSSTSDITFNTNKFTVAGDTGNTLVAGTFTSSGVATLADASTLATSAAPTADAEIANKKFVDDKTWNNDASTVFNTTATAATTFQDLDLSSNVGSTFALCFLEITVNDDGIFVCKPKGFGGAYTTHIPGSATKGYGGCVVQFFEANDFAYVTVATDSAGVIQIAYSDNATTVTIKLVGFIGSNP